MIKSWRHKGLREFFETGRTAKIDAKLHARVLRRLDLLKSARLPEDMNIPGFDFHALRGLPKRHSVHVNGPWCLTFGWDAADAVDVDLENYH